MRGACALAFSTLAVMAACSSFSADVSPVDGDAGADSAADGSEDGAKDAADDAPNLLTNGDFELGCGGWSTNSTAGDLTESTNPPPHGGAKSCLVCGKGDAGTTYPIYKNVTVDAPQGAQFYAEAYARTAPDASAPQSFGIRLDVYAQDGGIAQMGAVTVPPIDGTWSRASTTIDVTAAGGVLVRLTLRASPLDSCFLVDDARLVRTK